MKTRLAKAADSAAAMLIISLATLTISLSVGCDVKRNPYFDEDKKTFGLDGEGGDDEGSPRPTADGGSTDAVDTGGGGDDPGETTGDGDDSGGDGGSDGSIDPDTLISHNLYQARFDEASARGLIDGVSDPQPIEGILSTFLIGAITDREPDNVIVRQTYGDGIVNSQVQQDLTFMESSLGSIADMPAENGTLTVHRIRDEQFCPKTLICARKMTFTKQSDGLTTTFCYRDSNSQPVAVPYSPAPNFKASDWHDAGGAGTYGPFSVWRIDGPHIDCDATDLRPQAQQKFQIRISLRENIGVQENYFHYLDNALGIDYEVAMAFDKLPEGDNSRPYLDDTGRMQGKSIYQVNEAKGVIVKIIKTIRKDASLADSDDYWTQLLRTYLGPILPMDGILLDWHIELCEDRLLPEAIVRYCEEEE